jgi:hypothetical protein
MSYSSANEARSLVAEKNTSADKARTLVAEKNTFTQHVLDAAIETLIGPNSPILEKIFISAKKGSNNVNFLFEEDIFSTVVIDGLTQTQKQNLKSVCADFLLIEGFEVCQTCDVLFVNW